MPSPSSNGGANGAADVAAIRTLALVGPSAAGKTLLAEALLLQSGAITAAGSLERGSTVSDYDPLERKMQHSLNAAVMHLTLGDTRVHVIDTPGAPDLVGQALPALEAVETAAVVINAATGAIREKTDRRLPATSRARTPASSLASSTWDRRQARRHPSPARSAASSS